MLQSVCSNPTPEGLLEPPLATLKSIVNPDDFYPSKSRRRGEEGAPIVKVCIGPSGAQLREPEITESSGFPDLDWAAVKAAKAMRYAPAIENGAPATESCIKYKIKFKR
jgi:TonB family protein